MELVPDKQEIRRYLGYGPDAPIDSRGELLQDEYIQEMSQVIRPRFCYQFFSLEKGDNIFLPECNLHLPGKDIKKHLQNCKKIVLLAVTLGIEADNLIRVTEAESMSGALTLDAIATELTEQLCNHAEDEILQLVQKDNLFLTSRFSPGYGDLPITLQKPISEILDTPRKIGLTVTEHALMIPRKSVTAILGITEAPCQKSTHNCTVCSLKGQCRFQKEGSSHD